jgi:hypothetical protein
MITQLKTAAARYRQAHPGSADPRLIVSFPGVLSPRKVVPPDVEVRDGRFLQREARRFGGFEVSRDGVSVRLHVRVPVLVAVRDRWWWPRVQAMRTRRRWFTGLRNP